MNPFTHKTMTLIYLILIFVIVTPFFTQHASIMGVYNSDALYLPTLFNSIIIHHQSFFAWHLTPAPYFFPDMLIYFIIYFFIRNVFYASLIYTVIQCTLTLYLSTKIVQFIPHTKASTYIISITFLLAIAYPAFLSTYPYVYILTSAAHFGSLINELLLLVLLLQYIGGPKKRQVIAIFFIAAIAAASDLLFLIWFVAPYVASIFFAKIFTQETQQSLKKLLPVIISGCIIGILIKYSVTIDISKNFVFNSADFSWHKLIEFYVVYKQIFLANIPAGLFSLVFYSYLFFKIATLPWSKKTNQANFIYLFLFFSIGSAISSIIIAKNPYGYAMDQAYFRYISIFYWYPLIFSWLLLVPFIKHQALDKVLTLALFSTLLVLFIKQIMSFSSYQGVYFPETVRCVDTTIHQYNLSHHTQLRYGISGYWEAKLITMFSQEKLVVVSYTPDLERQLIITTPEMYRNQYDFAVISYKNKSLRLDENLLKQLNGDPILKADCSNNGKKIFVIIYRHGIKLPKFI